MFELTPPSADLDSQIAIRALTPDVLTCSFPFKRYGVLKIGGRGCIGMWLVFHHISAQQAGACLLLRLLVLLSGGRVGTPVSYGISFGLPFCIGKR